MKFTVLLNKEREEEVLIYAHERTRLIDDIERLVTENGDSLIAFKEKQAVRLNIADTYCFIVEDNRVYAITQNDKLHIKSRLYKLEEVLPNSFVKINQSSIANINKIEKFDASLSGSLMVYFKNGFIDYVSRRNLKKVKERIGL